MTELFRRYRPETAPEEREDSPACIVAYPAPCGEHAVGEGWGCLPFCERHWCEASLAAHEELAETVENELRILADAEAARFDTNAAVVRSLGSAGGLWSLPSASAYDAALAAAFPTEGLEDRTDPETANFDYAKHYGGDGPVDWWSDACILLLRFMRQTSEKGLPVLTRDLEWLRERATVQRVLAERDYERRYVARQREPKEAGADV